MRQVSRGGHDMQSSRRRARICKHILTARQRLDEWLLGEGHIDHPHFGAGPRAVGARQTGTQTGCCNLLSDARDVNRSRSSGCETIATQPAWMKQIMEAEATGLADQAVRVQQQVARGS